MADPIKQAARSTAPQKWETLDTPTLRRVIEILESRKPSFTASDVVGLLHTESGRLELAARMSLVQLADEMRCAMGERSAVING